MVQNHSKKMSCKIETLVEDCTRHRENYKLWKGSKHCARLVFQTVNSGQTTMIVMYIAHRHAWSKLPTHGVNYHYSNTTNQDSQYLEIQKFSTSLVKTSGIIISPNNSVDISNVTITPWRRPTQCKAPLTKGYGIKLLLWGLKSGGIRASRLLQLALCT